jgi:hypothetical protein
MRLDSVFEKAGKASKEKGACYVIRSGIKIVINWLWYYYYKHRPQRTFVFQGKTYKYFYHPYATTWRNERAVEVPIIWDIVKKYSGKKILEVGNVLSHYFPVNHSILDKYEKADDVINQDVVDFRSSKKYDLIASISTLEHVGLDEDSREPMKILRAIENLKTLIVPKGKMIVTLPLGFNPVMDRLLKEDKMQFTKRYCLKRISKDNEWIEVNWEDIKNARYNYPFNDANGLVIGIIEK